MSKVIAVANQKGGVAKTMTTLSIGVGLARKGKKVLLIDADAQGDLTTALGYKNADDMDVTLTTVMEKIIRGDEIGLDYGILKQKEGIDLLPGNIELSGMEVSVVNVMSRELILREYINSIREHYDYIIIDCPPSLGMITINAFASVDSVLIPLQAAYLPIKGLQQLIRTIGKVKRQINQKLEFEGILFTMVDARTTYAQKNMEKIREAYGNNIYMFKTNIPQSVRAAETPACGISIYQHDPKGKVALAYEKVVEEVLAHEQANGI